MEINANCSSRFCFLSRMSSFCVDFLLPYDQSDRPWLCFQKHGLSCCFRNKWTYPWISLCPWPRLLSSLLSLFYIGTMSSYHSHSRHWGALVTRSCVPCFVLLLPFLAVNFPVAGGINLTYVWLLFSSLPALLWHLCYSTPPKKTRETGRWLWPGGKCVPSSWLRGLLGFSLWKQIRETLLVSRVYLIWHRRL